MRGLEDAGDAHFQRVDAGEIKHVFRGGNDVIPDFQAALGSDVRSEDAIS